MYKVMKALFFTSFLLTSLWADGISQSRFSTFVGIGLGGHFEERFPYAEKKSNGRIAIFITPYYHFSSMYFIGLSAMVSGRMSAILGGAPAPVDYYDPLINTMVVNFNNLSTSTFLVKNRLQHMLTNRVGIYGDFGIGVTTYSYTGHTRTSLALAPELGFTLGQFQLSATLITGGRTPAFTEFSTFSNMNSAMNSIESTRFYLGVAYKIFQL
jgi:hypothetical protein